jgi:AraC-like DNA-binding protein
MRFPVLDLEPSMPAHVFAQILESDTLNADAVATFRAIIEREGIILANLLSPGAQLPIRWFREAYPTLDADQAACIGYLAGEQARLTSYSVLSLPLVSAGSVSEVLRLLTFLPLISNVVQAHFLEREEAVFVMLVATSGDSVLDQIPLFYCASALTHLLSLLSSETLDLTINIPGRAPALLANHAECQSGRLRFNAPVFYIRLPRATLDAVCRFSDPMVYDNAVAQLQSLLDARSQPDDLISRVRRILEVGSAQLRMESVAATLNVSVSTFKRRLAELNTSFSTLQEEMLSHRARLMLMDATLSLECIATTLGYSDLSNFSHAFKRWTGHSPGAFRRL